MKKLFYLMMTALLVLCAVSCKKEKKDSTFGVDGYTPLPKAIDIGCVVNGHKVLWASCNLGASKEWEYGNFYAWGETDAKIDFTEGNYTYKDNPAVLPLNKDAANVHLGGKWRIPTFEDFQALRALEGDSDYTFERYVKYGNNVKDAAGQDVYGLRITRTSTGATLFIPAAGYYTGTEYITDPEGNDGAYWTSTLNTGNPANAVDMLLGSAFGTSPISERFNGDSIRPVCEE